MCPDRTRSSETDRRHGLQPDAERVACGLQGLLPQIDEAEIVAHEADEPNTVVDLLDAEPLTGRYNRDIDALALNADWAAMGDQDLAIMAGIGQIGQPNKALTMAHRPRPGVSCRGLMGPFGIEFGHEVIETGLLLQEVHAR